MWKKPQIKWRQPDSFPSATKSKSCRSKSTWAGALSHRRLQLHLENDKRAALHFRWHGACDDEPPALRKERLQMSDTKETKSLNDALTRASKDQEFAVKLVGNPQQFKEEYQLTEEQMANISAAGQYAVKKTGTGGTGSSPEYFS
jgi:hypothetical protein